MSPWRRRRRRGVGGRQASKRISFIHRILSFRRRRTQQPQHWYSGYDETTATTTTTTTTYLPHSNSILRSSSRRPSRLENRSRRSIQAWSNETRALWRVQAISGSKNWRWKTVLLMADRLVEISPFSESFFTYSSFTVGTCFCWSSPSIVWLVTTDEVRDGPIPNERGCADKRSIFRWAETGQNIAHLRTLTTIKHETNVGVSILGLALLNLILRVLNAL